MSFERYRVLIRYDKENEEFVATVPELPSFEEQRAEDRVELMEQLEEAFDSVAQEAAGEDGSLPPPIDSDDSPYDGELTIPLGASLHKELAHRAVAEKISPDQLAANVIGMYLGRQLLGREEYRDDRQDQERGDRGGRRGRRRKQSYHQVMEDKASFLEYVRQQERSYGNKGRRNK
mgnify:CR=1 FL=1